MIALLLAAELAAGKGAASWDVRKPVSFALRSYAADVEVALSPSPRVTVTAAGRRVRLVGGGDRVEAEFDGKRQLHDGKVRVELPKGSALDVSAVSGRVSIAAVGGPVRVRGMSGEIHVAGASEADVETVDGAVEIVEPTGAVRLHGVSGALSVRGSSPAARLEVESASGPVTFRGPCAEGCHLDVDSVSGEVTFLFEKRSSLTARVVSTSGKVQDTLGLSLQRRPHASEGDFSEGALGGGEGLVECETFSGNVGFRGP